MAFWDNDPVVGEAAAPKGTGSTSAASKGLAPKAMSREEAIKAKAREEFKKSRERTRTGVGVLDYLGDTSDAALATVGGTLNIGPNILAGVRSVGKGTSYKDELIYEKELNQLRQGQSIPGMVGGALAGGAGLAKAGTALTAKLASSSAPAVAKVGNVLSRAAQLQQGQKYRNAARIVGVGAGTGAAQAASGLDDPIQGAKEGAIWSAVIPGGINAARAVGSRVRNFARPSSTDAARGLQETVEQAPAALRARYEKLQQATGTDLPLTAAMRQPDYDRVVEQIARVSPESAETARQAAKGHINTFPKRMLQHVNAAGDEAARTMRQMVRGKDGKPVNVPLNANINELNQLRDDAAEEAIQPIRNQLVDLQELRPSLDEDQANAFREIGLNQKELSKRLNRIFKKNSPGDIQGSDIDPTTGRRGPSGNVPGFGEPVEATVGELDRLRRALNNASRAVKNSSPGNSAIYRSAAERLEDFISSKYETYKPALASYAANSRMIEGFEAASAGKRISDIDDVQLSKNLRTTEGRMGMAAGEMYRQREAVGSRPSSAIRAAREYASGANLTRQADPLNPTALQPGTVTENLSPKAAEDLSKRSGIEYDALQRSLSASGINAAKEGDNALDNPESLFYGLASLSPTAMMITRARFWSHFVRNLPTGLNPKVAENLTEMLFSANPNKAKQALTLLERVGGKGALRRALDEGMSTQVPATAIGIGAGGNTEPASPEAAPAAGGTWYEQDAPVEPQAFTGPEAVLAPDDYQGRLQQIVASQPEGFAEFVNRMEVAESSRNPHAVSKKGARNVMQVMPATGPDAAEYAGVPFDEELYRSDPEYGRLLGAAYMAWLLPQFDNDKAKALAAYNDGPADAKKYVDKPNWRSHAPSETQDYIKRVLG